MHPVVYTAEPRYRRPICRTAARRSSHIRSAACRGALIPCSRFPLVSGLGSCRREAGAGMGSLTRNLAADPTAPERWLRSLGTLAALEPCAEQEPGDR
jgi:hypothetical protein